MSVPPPVTFSLEKDVTKTLGNVYRPLATVYFWSPLDRDWRGIKMLIDTGADYSLLPRFTAVYLGLDLTHAKAHDTVGVGGGKVALLVTDVKVRLGKHERTIPLGVVNQKIPPLMGRHLFFETFRVEFKGRQTVTFSDLG